VLVLDTSAYLNGRRDHYPPDTFPSVRRLIEEAMSDGRVIAPREVYRELTAKDDDCAEWVKERAAVFIDPRRMSSAPPGWSTACSPGPGGATARTPS
jgi:hypothetical protein